MVFIFYIQVALSHPQDTGVAAATISKSSSQLQLCLSKSGISLCRGTTQVYMNLYVKHLIQCTNVYSCCEN